MVVLPAGVLLEPQPSLLQQVRRHGEVDLRMPDVGVPQVDREVVKEPLHVRPLLIPADQTMDGGAMAQIVQPRLVAGTVRPPYPRVLREALRNVLSNVF